MTRKILLTFRKPSNKSEFLVENPQHTSKNQINEIFHKKARIKAGLSAVASMYMTKETDKMIPSLKYNPNPKVGTATLLKETLRNDKIKKENLANDMSNHRDIVGRIQDLEDASFRIREFKRDNPTFTDIKENFKKSNLEHYSKTFGNITIGVHGKELPKFQASKEKWWEKQNGYNYFPKYQSSQYMQQDRNPFKVNS